MATALLSEGDPQKRSKKPKRTRLDENVVTDDNLIPALLSPLVLEADADEDVVEGDEVTESDELVVVDDETIDEDSSLMKVPGTKVDSQVFIDARACFCTAAIDASMVPDKEIMSEQWKPSPSPIGWRAVLLMFTVEADTVASRQGSPESTV